MDELAGPVQSRITGRIGHITLARPRALNALDLRMVQLITVALETWREDPRVQAVVIDASGDRAFCAGGDVRSVRDAVLGKDFDTVESFFVQEYALNRAIARYPKPFVALVDGICMGGGIGLSVHGSIRVASEHASFAMPETQLGLFPDVGGSYFLPRLRGGFGMYLGLTGARIGGADACWVGLATHFVSRSRFASLTGTLAGSGPAAVAEFAEPLRGMQLPDIAGKVDAVFGADSLDAVFSSLERMEGDPWADTALTALRSASPSALRWTFDLLRDGAGRSLEQCLFAETLLTRRACRHPDFAEGVRANVVDKDRKPKWQALDS